MIEMILDQCLADLRARHATVAECLGRFPDYAVDLAPLLELAMALESVDVKPSPEFKAATRARLARRGVAPPPRHTRLAEYLYLRLPGVLTDGKRF